DDRFPLRIVAGHRHHGPDRIVRGLGHIVGPSGVERLEHECAGRPTATCSPPEVWKPKTNSIPSRPSPKGLVQSMTILLVRLPRPFAAASVAGHGVASTTTPASLAASAGGLIRSFGKPAYLGSAGWRRPQLMSSPCLSQAWPTAAPTEPAPMTAICMDSLLL